MCFEGIADWFELGVGAGEHGNLAGSNEPRIGAYDVVGDTARFGLGIGPSKLLDSCAIAAVGNEISRLAADGEDMHARPNDLWSTAVVDREPDDLDPGKAGLDVDQERRVGTVESVDRLCRIANQEQVITTGAEKVDEPMLQRVEVLGLVDQEVPESPPQRVGELRVVLHVTNDERQHVVEIDDAALALELLEVGEHRSCSFDPCVRASLLTPGRRSIVVCGDATRRRPIDLADQAVDAAPLRRIEHVAHQPPTIGDDIARPAPGVFPTLLQHRKHHRVERASLDTLTHAQAGETTTEFTGGLAGEGQRQRVARIGLLSGDAPCNATCEHSGLAGAGTGDDRDEVRVSGDRSALVRIQISEECVGVHGNHPRCALDTVGSCHTRRSC